MLSFLTRHFIYVFFTNNFICICLSTKNHAIRRADMGKRILETLYPTSNIDKKSNGLWTWIMNKLGLGRSDDTKSEDLDSESLMFPWHLMKSKDDTLLIINRR